MPLGRTAAVFIPLKCEGEISNCIDIGGPKLIKNELPNPPVASNPYKQS